MLTVVIPFRNEDMLDFTIRRIQETADVPVEIITVDDGSDVKIKYPMPDQAITLSDPVGNCFARDIGIEAASNDAVFIIDAHMNFPPGWASWLVDNFNAGSKKRVSCTVCPVLNREDMEMRPGRSKYHGAYLKWTDTSFGRRRALPNKWGPFVAPCQVGCVLGGAYLLSRDWYMQLGRPWKYMRDWGHSEQIISLVNYLVGGENWILDIEIGHMFRTGKFNEVPYRTFLHNIYYNQQVVLDVCVDSKADSKQLSAHIALDIEEHGMTQAIARQLREVKVAGYAEWVRKTSVRTWEQYKSEWIEPYNQEKKA